MMTNAETLEVTTVEENQEMDSAYESSMNNLTEMRREAYTNLVATHLQSLTKIMMSSNGVTELQKRQANKALVEAVTFALNFGIKDDNGIRDRGAVLARETNNLAGILVQALDNRMLMLANRMNQSRLEETEKTEETVSLNEEKVNNEQTTEEVKES